ncbi:alpha-2-macroglobulin family protein [Phormidium sp. CLA17]|uniref:alpha-2-macroglobulin family protein n=1 Tax=Leptolyngbya sp. Cla-17 TaxID=2803751 RepID=UPI001492164C|nr:alpha-2-macroglobulin [Leptolyngbya sp. Cla-17]MBM0742738.1 alpha-2-macroglobulin family protein [Leptolyngbya sp. Cla-17]
MRLGKRFVLPLLFLCGIVIAVSFSGCSTTTMTKAPEVLTTVAVLEKPSLPDWIEEISPTGNAKPQAQIRIRFKEALIPVESLESKDQQQLLQKFEVVPALKGQFRFLTPRMVGFQADEAIPQATRVRVTLKAGLADLKNHKLDKDLAWTFQSDRLKLTNLPTSYSADSPKVATEPLDIKPVLKVFSNVELDQASLKEHAKLKESGQTDGVALKVALEKQPEVSDTPNPEAEFDPSTQSWIYTLEPESALKKATQYTLEVTPGLRPLKGNLPSEESFVSRVETYAPLAFQKQTATGKPDGGGAYGRFVNGIAQLEFNNSIAAESALANISISPEPKNKDVPLVRAYEGDRVVSLNPWALEPATNYTITVGADLKDSFGQTLDKPVTVSYQTGDTAPDIWAPTELHIFPTAQAKIDSPLQLNISTVNLSAYRSAFAIVQPTDLVYSDSAYPQNNGKDLLPNVSTWKTTKVQNQKNQSVESTVPLQKLLGGSTGMLAYGVQARTVQYQEEGKQKWREPNFYGMVQVTNLGVFAQWFPDSGLVRVHHLSDGLPVANATVQIYKSQLEAKDRSTPTPCATGKTDAAGMLTLSAAQFQGCRTSGSETAPPLLAIAQSGKDWAFTRTTEYSGAYGYGVDSGWESGKPLSRGTIFSDRQLYQPGETAHFTGAAYYLQAGTLKQDKNVRYAITLESPDGQKKTLDSQSTNAFGTFSLEVPLEKTQPLGTYTMRAKGDSGAEITGDFRVAEFKPPNFKVKLSLSGVSDGKGTSSNRDFPPEPDAPSAPVAIALPDQKIEATAQSNYLFGAPVEGGEAKYYVTRQQTEFAPQNWDGYSFGRRWLWPEEAPEVPSDVLQTTQTLSKEGQTTQSVTVAKDLPYPMTYRVDAQVSDVSNLSVADSQTFVALPSDRLIGLKTDFVAEAGKEFPVQVIVTDAAGKPMPEKVKVELQSMTYSDITRLVEGSRTAQNQVEYKTVSTTEVDSEQAAQTARLIAPKSGSYRIRAMLAGNSNEAAATEVQLWATGNEPTFWGDRYNNNRLEVKLDKKSYRAGDMATAIIQSPYPDAELYFAVVRHGTLSQTAIQVKGSAPQIQFTVTPEMMPNAAVEAVLIRQGKPLEQTEPGSLNDLVKIGFASFNTELSDRYLNVEIQPTVGSTASTPAQPGTEQTLNLMLKDAVGNPTKGEFTVMVVNEAVLQLSGYRPPDLVKTVFAEQPISTRLADNRPDVVLSPMTSPLQKGWGYGGGVSAGAANTRTRTDFKALAYYNGAVLTDDSGKAQVKFTLPDDLTTWRVMAVATDGNLHFGKGDTTFITSQPLVSNPILPQFTRPGDRFQVGVSVTNNTGQAGIMVVNGTVTEPLKFDNSNGSEQVEASTGTSATRFPVVVSSPGTAQIKFTTQLSGREDAFEVPLEVKPLDVTEQVVESGTTENQATIPLNVDNNVATDAGGLDISLASSLIPQLVAPAQQVLDDQLPFAEPAASKLAIAANLQTLSQTYGQTFSGFNPSQQTNSAIDQLKALQKPDGGFAAYPGAEKSDPFVTAYAAQAIAQTKQAQTFPTLRNYLSKTLADPGQYDFCKQSLCKNQLRLQTLIALADLGDKRTEFVADIYTQRDQLDPVDQIKLARHLSQLPDWRQEANSMAKDLQEMTRETGRSAQANLPQGWRWLSSSTATQAEALKLAVVQKAKPDAIAKLAQGLLNQRRNGTWQSTYDNAAALSALVETSKLQPTLPNFTATAELAGKTLASAPFQGYQNPSKSVTVALSDLPRGKNDLTLKKTGNGILHYLVAYRYRLQGNQPGRLNGLRITRTLRPANQEQILHTTGLYAVDSLKVPVGQVYDVGLEIITDHPVDQVIITDPLPAGFEAVDDSFQTSTPYFKAKGDSWQVSYQTTYKDRIVAFGDRLNPGVYTLHYLVRSVTPGTFIYPGAEVYLQYAPEEFGRSASTTLIVEEGKGS